MKLYNVKLLTITCEILAQENILEILKKNEITGYTKYEVDGNGARGLRGQGFKNEKNVKIEVIIREEKFSNRQAEETFVHLSEKSRQCHGNAKAHFSQIESCEKCFG